MQVKEPKLLAKFLGALCRKGYVNTVGIARGFKLAMALLEEGYVHGPNQAESQAAKLFAMLTYLKISFGPWRKLHKSLHSFSHTFATPPDNEVGFCRLFLHTNVP